MYSPLQEEIWYDDSIKVRICITDEVCLIGKCPKKPSVSHNCPPSLGLYQTCFPSQIMPIICTQNTSETQPQMGTPWGFRWSCKHILPNETQWQTVPEISWLPGANHQSHCYQKTLTGWYKPSPNSTDLCLPSNCIQQYVSSLDQSLGNLANKVGQIQGRIKLNTKKQDLFG